MRAAPDQRPRVGLRTQIAAVFGLSGLAVAQPLLDLFGRNPEFFIMGRYSRATIVLFAAVIVVLPGLFPALLVALATRVRGGLGHWTYLAVIGGLGAVVANVVVRGLGADRALVSLAAAAGGAAAAVALTRVAPGRLLLSYLAAGNVLFLASFLFLSPTSSLLVGSADDDLGEVEVPELSGPVVVLVLDEFPLTTLLRSDGTINAERYPAFAELAERTTWFRNASSVHTVTDHAVPAILTGSPVDGPELPTYQDHPRNLFTMLGDAVPVNRYELLTDLCPSRICDRPPARSLSGAFKDAAVVYGHRTLPARWRTDLPSIGHSWGDFGEELGADVTAEAAAIAAETPTIDADNPFAKWYGLDELERGPAGQAAILEKRTSQIDATPALHFVHVALPHYPWVLTPWGTRLLEFPIEARITEYPDEAPPPDDPAYAWIAHLLYQLQSMQAGAVDVAIGNMIQRLEEAGAWDDATIVVMSDHGASLTAPDFGRTPTANNKEELYRVPLFIKAPGQQAGERRDDPALTIDVLPTLVDLLGITTDWRFGGHSLFDGSEASVAPLVAPGVAPALDVVRSHVGTSERWDWVGLAAAGEHAAMVGEPTESFRVGAPSTLTWSPDAAADFDQLPVRGDRMPQVLTGVIHGATSARPPELVVSVNGRIGGCLAGYTPTDGGWRFLSYLAPFLRNGANEIRAFEVDTSSGEAVLHEVT